MTKSILNLFFISLSLIFIYVSGFKAKLPQLKRFVALLASTENTSSFQSLTSDDSITKEIISKGTGKRVEAGDILAVEYVASTLSGKVFAKGEKEKFTYKDGSMIKGWDIAVGSMKIGEKAKFKISNKYAYGEKGVGFAGSVIPPNCDLQFEIRLQAWLGNQMRPESLFQKDLDVDPFIASTPEAIQAEFDNKQAKQEDKYEGSIFDIYLRRIRNISFGFGGSGFFVSQSGEKAPWYLNPNITFPSMILFVIMLFSLVFTSGGVKEKGIRPASDLDVAVINIIPSSSDSSNLFS